MSWSAAEIDALATKAARGAGAPAGQAARFGKTAVRHLCADRAPQELSAALHALPAGPILTVPLVIDTMLARASQGSVELPDVTFDGMLMSYVETLPFAAWISETNGSVTLAVDTTRPAQLAKTKRIQGCAPLVKLMGDLAARTFVPETDASRRSGAGAGLTDND